MCRVFGHRSPARESLVEQGVSGMATPPVRLSEAIDAHQALRQVRVAPSTFNDEARVLRWLLRHCGDMQVRNIKPDHVEVFFAGLLRPHTDLSGAIRPGLGASTFNLTRARLRQPFLRYLVRRGLTRHDLLEGVGPLRVPKKVHPQAGPDRLLALSPGSRGPPGPGAAGHCRQHRAAVALPGSAHRRRRRPGRWAPDGLLPQDPDPPGPADNHRSGRRTAHVAGPLRRDHRPTAHRRRRSGALPGRTPHCLGDRRARGQVPHQRPGRLQPALGHRCAPPTWSSPTCAASACPPRARGSP